MDSITYTPIGIIRTPFAVEAGMPIQAVAAQGVRGRIELDPALALGLRDLEGFSHVTLLFHMHLITSPALEVTPFLDTKTHGIFATRSPRRPNAIGLSTVRLLHIDGTTLHIEEVDMLDGTPLLDIKPYVPQFDVREGATIGWFSETIHKLQTVRADDRFR